MVVVLISVEISRLLSGRRKPNYRLYIFAIIMLEKSTVKGDNEGCELVDALLKSLNGKPVPISQLPAGRRTIHNPTTMSGWGLASVISKV